MHVINDCYGEIKGEMFWNGDFTEAPYQAVQFPPDDHRQMLNFFISAYVVNTLGLVLHKHNIFTYKLSKSDVGMRIFMCFIQFSANNFIMLNVLWSAFDVSETFVWLELFLYAIIAYI